MRFIVASCVLLSCSAASAERIYIEAASATYFSRSQQFEIKVWFDRPIDLTADYLSFFARPVGERWQDESLSLRNDGFAGQIDATMEVRHTEYGERPTPSSERPRLHRDMGLAPYSNDGRVLTVTMPFSQTGLLDPMMNFSLSAIGGAASGGVWASALEGQSSINDRSIHAPEPSTLMLVAAAHLLWLPRLRQRFGKRHVAG